MINRDAIQFTQSNQVRGSFTCKALEEAEKDKRFLAIGDGMGLGFSFIKDEVILFPKPEEAFPFTKKFREKDLLYIAGYSDKRNRFVDIPVSAFRKRPVGEGESDSFYDEETRPLNCRLAEATNDLARFRILCETGAICCTDIFELHAWVFETDADGKVHRTDKMKPLSVASIEAVKEEPQAANAAA